jgi:hypothetical protein
LTNPFAAPQPVRHDWPARRAPGARRASPFEPRRHVERP